MNGGTLIENQQSAMITYDGSEMASGVRSDLDGAEVLTYKVARDDLSGGNMSNNGVVTIGSRDGIKNFLSRHVKDVAWWLSELTVDDAIKYHNEG